MSKDKKRNLIITTIVCLLPMILSVILYDRLPDQVGVHFDMAGNADNYMPKAFAAFGLPVILAALNVLSSYKMQSDSSKESAPTVLRYLYQWLIPVLSVILVPITLFLAIGVSIPVAMIGASICGIIFIITGNYLPKVKKNSVFGILKSSNTVTEEQFRKVNRFTGFVWVFGGMAFIIACFLESVPAVIAIVAIMVVLPYAYYFIKSK